MNKKEEVLTREKAIDITIELWTWLARTGADTSEKGNWDGFAKYEEIDWDGSSYCPLCAYRDQQPNEEGIGCGKESCKKHCPYAQHFGETCYQDDTNFDKWEYATTKATRKKYAKLFLLQLLELDGKPEKKPKPAPKPKEEWEDIADRCPVRVCYHPSEAAWIALQDPDSGHDIFLFGSKGIESFGQGKDVSRYKLETHPTGGCSYSICGGFKIMKRIK